jgi:signal transduction histidine kinase
MPDASGPALENRAAPSVSGQPPSQGSPNGRDGADDASPAAPADNRWPGRTEWLLIIGAWVAITLLTVTGEVIDSHGGAVNWGHLPMEMGQQSIECIIWILLTPLILRLAQLLPVERPRAARNVVVHLGIAFLVSVGADVADGMLRTALLPDPQRAGFDAIMIVTRFWFVNELVVYFVVLAAGFARDYYLQKQERQREAKRLRARTMVLEQQLTEARLQALRMQLNPHFLFNTLHAVSTLVGRDPQGVRRMIARLSDLLRHVLDDETPQEVPLGRELEFLDGYLEIQTIRFQGRLDVHIDVPDRLHPARIPNLILQPVVENAIRHGASQVRGTGEVWLEAERDGRWLLLHVRDNGPGLEGDGAEHGTGLANVEARLRELYGQDQDLRVASDPDGGTVATLQLPYHTGSELYASGTVGSDAPLSRPSPADEEPADRGPADGGPADREPVGS